MEAAESPNDSGEKRIGEWISIPLYLNVESHSDVVRSTSGNLHFVKGLGPREFASRARISLTALYQIEAGKTGHPRAATLGRIAEALQVPTEDLVLGWDGEAKPSAGHLGPPEPRRPQDHSGTSSSAGSPRSLLDGTEIFAASISNAKNWRLAADAEHPRQSIDDEWLLSNEGELISKLHDILYSPVGRGVARILEELHRVLPQSRRSI